MDVGLRSIALVIVVVLAGCSGGLVADDPGTPGKTAANDSNTTDESGADETGESGDRFDAELSFTESAEEVGFDYASNDTGIGNGNDGVYAVDYDNDLRTDVLAIGGPDPVLFENTGGEFERSDALPTISGTVQGALFFDYDTDDWEDLLVLRRGDTPVFLENRNGSYHRVDVGLDEELAVPLTASAADYDGDGCPDLFVAQYGDWSDGAPRAWQTTLDFDEDNGNSNLLYRGNCDGFERVDDAGIEGNHWSMATSFVDLDGDDLPDIHVANDYYNDTVYYNDGEGTFSREYLGAKTDRNGMSSEVADLDGDGHQDVFVTNIFFPRDLEELSEAEREQFTNFLVNRLGKRGKGNNVLLGGTDGFEYAGERLGVDEGGWGWAAIVVDFDSDGENDVFHTTQHVLTIHKSDPIYPYPMAWVQENGSFHRQNASEIGLEMSDDRGAAHLDVDRTGTADIAVAGYAGEYRLYRNDADQGNSVQVRVRSGTLDHTAIGAEVYATVDGETSVQVNNAKADYQSQDTRFLHVGLGDADAIEELRVVWPDGTEQAFEDVAANQRIVVTPDGIQERAPYDNASGSDGAG